VSAHWIRVLTRWIKQVHQQSNKIIKNIYLAEKNKLGHIILFYIYSKYFWILNCVILIHPKLIDDL
jgi:hypothetical protein